MNLNYKELGSKQSTPLLILHGVFGSLDNWQTLGNKFAQDYRVFLIDQRNHGRSPHHEDMNYPILAQDLHRFVEEHQLKSPLIIGHSMGGKVVMEYALTYPDNFSKIVVVDIAVRAYNIDHHYNILQGLNAIGVNTLKSRKEADEKLAAYIPDNDTRLFLLKNLNRTKEGFSWKMNIASIEKNIQKIGDGIGKSAPNKQNEKPFLVINGGQSGYIKERDIPQIKAFFPNAQIHTIEEAGHWVHAQTPVEFYETTINFLKS